jgi:hypothetical protein
MKIEHRMKIYHPRNIYSIVKMFARSLDFYFNMMIIILILITISQLYTLYFNMIYLKLLKNKLINYIEIIY